MTLGLVSDTHRYFHPTLRTVFSEVDQIFHAGDIGDPKVIAELNKIAPTTAVYGNIDGEDIRKDHPEIIDVEIEGQRIVMIHIAGRPGRWYGGIEKMLEEKKPDLFICGHSHILQVERVKNYDGMLFVNPGAAGKQGIHKIKTCARIQIGKNGFSKMEVIHLDEF